MLSDCEGAKRKTCLSPHDSAPAATLSLSGDLPQAKPGSEGMGAKRETCLSSQYASGHDGLFQRHAPGPGGVFRSRPAPPKAPSAPGAASPTSLSFGWASEKSTAPAASLPSPEKMPQAQPGFLPVDTPKAGPGSAGAVFAFAKTVTVDDLPESGVAQGVSGRLGIPVILSPTPAPEGANPCLSDTDAKPQSESLVKRIKQVMSLSGANLGKAMRKMSQEELDELNRQWRLSATQREARKDQMWDLHYRSILRGRELYKKYSAIDPRHPRLPVLQHSCFACRMYAGHRAGADGERFVTIGFADGEVSWMGTNKCGSGRFCVLCGAQISSKNQEDIEKGLQNTIKKGGSALLLTYTIPHRAAQSAMELVENLSLAYTLAGKGGDMTRLRKKFGIKGSITRQEETFGQNGWHPHLHVILIFGYVLSNEEIAEVTEKLKQKWQAACYKIDIIPPHRTQAFEKRGFRADPIMNTKDVAEYLSKVGWINSSAEFKARAKESILNNSEKGFSGAAFELSSRDAKAPRMAEGRTPWDIHTGFVNGDPRDTKLWLDYIEAFAGKPVIRWSPGLKALLRIDDEDEEDQVKADEETSLSHIYRVSDIHYEQGVARNCLWRPILKAVDKCDFSTLQTIADRYVIDFMHVKEENSRYPEILSQASIRETEADRQRLRRKEADKRRREKAARLKAKLEDKERARIAAEQAYAVSLLSGDEIARMKAGRRVYQQKQKDERRKRRDLLRQAKTGGKGSVSASGVPS